MYGTTQTLCFYSIYVPYLELCTRDARYSTGTRIACIEDLLDRLQDDEWDRGQTPNVWDLYRDVEPARVVTTLRLMLEQQNQEDTETDPSGVSETPDPTPVIC